MSKIKDQVYNEIKKLTKSKFSDDSNVYDIGIDSLDLVELITKLEDHYQGKISDEELVKIKKVSQIIAAIKKLKP